MPKRNCFRKSSHKSQEISQSAPEKVLFPISVPQQVPTPVPLPPQVSVPAPLSPALQITKTQAIPAHSILRQIREVQPSQVTPT